MQILRYHWATEVILTWPRNWSYEWLSNRQPAQNDNDRDLFDSESRPKPPAKGQIQQLRQFKGKQTYCWNSSQLDQSTEN